MFASRGFVDVTKTLVKYGAKVDLDAKDRSTALHIAAFQGSPPIISYRLLPIVLFAISSFLC